MAPVHTFPLDAQSIDDVWIEAAARLGFRVERVDAAYASSDGSGAIQIGTPATLDADDSVAQLVLHELCHALVQGEDNLERPDWGLDNTTERDVVRENACLRVQAEISGRFGLRRLMTPTTVTKPYYQALGQQALSGPDGDGAVCIANQTVEGTLFARWYPTLATALLSTARHVLESVDCRDCGACCREAFDSVTVGLRDPVVWKHPTLIVRHGPRFELRREEGCCAALESLAPDPGPRFSCRIYDERPRACRDFQKGSAKCVQARRRLDLSL